MNKLFAICGVALVALATVGCLSETESGGQQSDSALDLSVVTSAESGACDAGFWETWRGCVGDAGAGVGCNGKMAWCDISGGAGNPTFSMLVDCSAGSSCSCTSGIM